MHNCEISVTSVYSTWEQRFVKCCLPNYCIRMQYYNTTAHCQKYLCMIPRLHLAKVTLRLLLPKSNQHQLLNDLLSTPPARQEHKLLNNAEKKIASNANIFMIVDNPYYSILYENTVPKVLKEINHSDHLNPARKISCVWAKIFKP